MYFVVRKETFMTPLILIANISWLLYVCALAHACERDREREKEGGVSMCLFVC